MKVTLVGQTEKPLDSICLAIAIMKEKDPLTYVMKLFPYQKEEMIKEILKSRLTGALEFAQFEFLLEDVTRAFTHQLVRHRTMHFSQQSLRFFDARESGFEMPKSMTEVHEALIKSHYESMRETYVSLIELGCATEDARSILPTNIHTKIMFGASLRGLLEMAEVRLCYQAQGEFAQAVTLIKEEINNKVDPFLASLFVPACDRSGKCEFKSVYDRECPKELERRKQ